MLRAFGHRVATCCEMLGVNGSNLTSTQHVATHRNTVAKRTQHVAPNNVDILCRHVAIVWLGLESLVHSPKRPKYNHDLDISCIPLANSLQ